MLLRAEIVDVPAKHRLLAVCVCMCVLVQLRLLISVQIHMHLNGHYNIVYNGEKLKIHRSNNERLVK